MVYDLVIKNGYVISFEPDSIQKTNIGISKGRIEIISTKEIEGHNIIDAAGKYVSPGFIDFHSHVGGKLFSAECILRQGATTTISGERNFDGKLIRQIAENGFLINQGFYVSHSFTLRRAVGCTDIYQAATPNEILDMKTLARQFFKNGAYGIHFGLEYVPGTSFEELYVLAEVAKEFDRVVLIHMRGDSNKALDHLCEVEQVALKTGASIHLLHLAYMIGFRNVMPAALNLIRNMQEKGCNITADTGLYPAYPNCIGSSILAGDWCRRYKREDKGFSEKNVLISSGIHAGEFCTKESFQFFRENYPNLLVIVFACDEEEIQRAVKEPYVFISSNAADGPHYEHVGHPETAGTFPKLIRKYVREDQIITLQNAIYKITWGPAKRFGIAGKGNLKKGFDADIVIFDFERIRDCADYPGMGDPNAPPEGIDYVIVNGDVACEKGIIYENLQSGKYLKHNF